MRQTRRSIDVGLVRPKGSFGGPQKYSSELAKLLVHRGKSVTIDDIKSGNFSVVSPVISFTINTMLLDLSKYKLIHNPCAYPMYNIRLAKDQILLTTAHEFQARIYPEISRLTTHTIKDSLWLYLAVLPSLNVILSSDYLMANSLQTLNEAVSLGFPKKKIFYAPHGIDRRFFTKLPKKTKRREFQVGYIGTLTPRKNIPSIIRMFKLIDDKSVKLEFWGKSIFRAGELERIIENDNRISLMGELSEQKLIAKYDSFDVFLHPSMYEGFGLPIQEAKARGLPVIIFKNSKISQEVRKYCFEARDEEHMAEIILNIRRNGYNEKQRKKAMLQARQFTWERTAQKTLEAYAKILGKDI